MWLPFPRGGTPCPVLGQRGVGEGTSIHRQRRKFRPDTVRRSCSLHVSRDHLGWVVGLPDSRTDQMGISDRHIGVYHIIVPCCCFLV